MSMYRAVKVGDNWVVAQFNTDSVIAETAGNEYTARAIATMLNEALVLPDIRAPQRVTTSKVLVKVTNFNTEEEPL